MSYRITPNRRTPPLIAAAAALTMLAAAGASRSAAEPKHAALPVTKFVEAYPDAIDRIDGNELVWRDGTRMPLDDGIAAKPFAAWIETPDIEDMLREPYPAGAGPIVPAPESDPGRARNAAFFEKMYGDCREGSVKPKLKSITWLPAKAGQRLEITTVNGVADRLEAVSKELDALPREFDKYLVPAAGSYNCRVIAGTGRASAHGYGIAIDIAVRQSDYWRWTAKGAGRSLAAGAGSEAGTGPGQVTYRNRIPLDIVHIFERHGFIWGGRWDHFDTMHFEYRPELLPQLAPL